MLLLRVQEEAICDQGYHFANLFIYAIVWIWNNSHDYYKVFSSLSTKFSAESPSLCWYRGRVFTLPEPDYMTFIGVEFYFLVTTAY